MDKRSKCVIYKATHKDNGKVYIGQTTEGLDCRRKRHAREKRGINYFKNAIQKHGIDAFNWEVICTSLSEEYLNDLEIYFIALHNSTDRELGYNTDAGGKRRASTFKHTQESKNKIRNVQLGIPKSPESVEKRRQSLLAKKMKRIISPEQRQKIRNSLLGNIPWNKGRKETREDVLKRQSESHKGSIKSNLTRMVKILDSNGIIHNSIQAASRYYNINSGDIYKFLKTGKPHKHTGIYFWRHKEDKKVA